MSYEAQKDGAKYPCWWRKQPNNWSKVSCPRKQLQSNVETWSSRPRRAAPADNLKMLFCTDTMIEFNNWRQKVAHKQSQLHSAHFCATPRPIIDLYIASSKRVSLFSYIFRRVLVWNFVASIHPNIRQSSPIAENFTSIQVVIPLWFGAEFPDAVVLWLAETRTVGVEL